VRRTPAALARRAAFASMGWALIAAGCGEERAPAQQPASPEPAAATPRESRRWFADRSHFIVADDPSLRGWQIRDVAKSETTPAGAVVFQADSVEKTPVNEVPAMRMSVRSWPQFEQAAGADKPVRRDFNSWGKSVAVADCAAMCAGFYWDWTLSARDVVRAWSVKPQAVVAGPARTWGDAVATDRQSERRERRDWYCWSTTTRVTYLAEFVTTDFERPMNDACSTKILAVMKSIRADAAGTSEK